MTIIYELLEALMKSKGFLNTDVQEVDESEKWILSQINSTFLKNPSWSTHDSSIMIGLLDIWIVGR